MADAVGAFLNGPLDEELHMQTPKRLENEHKDDEVWQLHKALCGLSQGAKQFWKLILRVLVSKLGHMRSKADPCLAFKWTEDGELVTWVLWIDDCLVCGPEKEAKLKIKKMGEH